jgi:two-component system, chemotaxis family, chemotaxis protein CheY
MLDKLRPPTIVVVDDNEVVLSTTRSVLESAGYRVLCHSRPSGCVALILQEKPDLVLLDVNMPSIASDTIVKLFGKAQPNSGTLVLLHSGLSVAALDAKARSCGAHGYVQKSDDPYQLLRQINGWLKRSGMSSGKMPAAAKVEGGDEDVANRPSGMRFGVGPSVPADFSLMPPSQQPPMNVSGTLPISLPSVLFVDDDMAALSAIRREVQTEPYMVEFALSGSHALRKILSKAPPELVVSDLLMPSPSGIEVYRRALQADFRWEKRFVFVTGAGMDPEIAGFLQRFPGRVLEKPVRGAKLRTVIREGLATLLGELGVGSATP